MRRLLKPGGADGGKRAAVAGPAEPGRARRAAERGDRGQDWVLLELLWVCSFSCPVGLSRYGDFHISH